MNTCPPEDTEQALVLRWAAGQASTWPELALLHHIPNGGHRAKRTAALLRGLGVKPGVPDLCLPIARGGFHGLYVEMKRRTGGRVEPEQREWLAALNAQGYLAVVAKGHEQAIAFLRDYLVADGEPDEPIPASFAPARGDLQNEAHEAIDEQGTEATDAAA